MISKAAKDYFWSFSLKKIFTGQIASYFWVIYFWMLPLYSMKSSGGNDFLAMYYAIYYGGGVISFLIGIAFMKVNPIQLSKLMFLSPFSREQRLQYLKAKFFIRTTFPMLLLFLIRLISYSIVGVRHWSILPADLYVICSIVGGSFASLNGPNSMDLPREKWEALQKEKSPRLKGMEMKSIIVMLAGLMGWILFDSSLNELVSGDITRTLMAEMVFLSAVLLIQLALTINLFRYLPAIFTMACDYERTGKIL